MKVHSDCYVANNSKIQIVPVAALIAYKHNARTHSPKQVQQIANSIKQFRFTNPVLVDAGNRIMAGHGRVEAAKKLGIDKVPIIRIDYLTEEQIRAYILADNKIAANAEWDCEFSRLNSNIFPLS
jgi:ParB-like chromosome segregation protein Spo0J